MAQWHIQREEMVRFWTQPAGGRRVTLANGAGIAVTSVAVRFTRYPGDPWGKPRVSVAHGKGWDLTFTNVPQGLRGGLMPQWLQDLVAECRP